MQTRSLPRRTFLGHAGAGVTALAGAAACIAAATDEKQAISNTDLAEAKPAELLLALTQQLDRDRLEAEHLAQLRLELESNLRRSALLSGFALTNADEPAPTFRAWRAEG